MDTERLWWVRLARRPQRGTGLWSGGGARQPRTGVVMHIHGGNEYTAGILFRTACQRLQIRQSMGRPGVGSGQCGDRGMALHADFRAALAGNLATKAAAPGSKVVERLCELRRGRPDERKGGHLPGHVSVVEGFRNEWACELRADGASRSIRMPCRPGLTPVQKLSPPRMPDCSSSRTGCVGATATAQW
jgi:hypothetical protein